jgi:hypothetical protein
VELQKKVVKLTAAQESVKCGKEVKLRRNVAAGIGMLKLRGETAGSIGTCLGREF